MKPPRDFAAPASHVFSWRFTFRRLLWFHHGRGDLLLVFDLRISTRNWDTKRMQLSLISLQLCKFDVDVNDTHHQEIPLKFCSPRVPHGLHRFNLLASLGPPVRQRSARLGCGALLQQRLVALHPHVALAVESHLRRLAPENWGNWPTKKTRIWYVNEQIYIYIYIYM